MDHQSRQYSLAGPLRLLVQPAGQAKGDVGIPDLHGRRQAQHIIDDALGEAHRAGHAGSDDVLSLLGVAAVPLGIEPDDAAAVHTEPDGGHQALIFWIWTLV